MTSIRHIGKNEFSSSLAHGLCLVDFFAAWCGPCRALSPVIDEIAAERSDIVVAKVNVDEEQALASEFGVFSIPTLVVLRDGDEVGRAVGARPKAAILELIDG